MISKMEQELARLSLTSCTLNVFSLKVVRRVVRREIRKPGPKDMSRGKIYEQQLEKSPRKKLKLDLTQSLNLVGLMTKGVSNTCRKLIVGLGKSF